MENDLELIELYISGDDNSLKELIEKYTIEDDVAFRAERCARAYEAFYNKLKSRNKT